jgi:dienelactone hydrolase
VRGSRATRALAGAVTALLVAAGCGGSQPGRADPVPERLGLLLEYDRSLPLGGRFRFQAARFGVVVERISFLVPGAGRVPGYLVRPARKGRHPAVVFVHGAGGSREDFAASAVALAQRGVAGLTFSSAFERYGAPVTAEEDRRLFVADSIAIRRALDLLAVRPQVDAGSLGVVGYSRGVEAAALVSAVDPRVDAVVLVAGRARLSDRAATTEDRALLAPLDAVRFVPHLSPAALLVQVGNDDVVVPVEDTLPLFEAASEPKELRRYSTGHGMSDEAWIEQVDWLVGRLAP